ncbi:hypothetical protein [Enterococcus sp. HY326]|uniref:hypothetical protein n=1 Tax=Enterococcus sp. HY326 TaxID=2971265 RepID=UPI00223E9193|nr:hypothetical protein [Enterococcus sp. HY326]
MVTRINLDNTEWPLEKILQQVGDELEAVVKLEAENGTDVMVIANDEWQHILELLGATQAQGYRLDDELPDSVETIVMQPDDANTTTGLVTDQAEPLHPEADFELEAGEIAESDDVLD